VIDLTLDEACRAMGASLENRRCSDPGFRFPPVSTDTRKLQPGHCFFCLSGPNFDAHDFIPEALHRGAAIIVHSRPVPTGGAEETLFLTVDDPLAALQRLAHYVRQKWGQSLIAVTGSTGKTTTRTFIAGLLGVSRTVHQSSGNLNNQIGVPLSLLGLEERHQAAVIELGMNHPGEIRLLSRLAGPETAVLTNVAPVHLEFFSDLDEIAAAKGEILENLSPYHLVVFNADDGRVCRLAESRDLRRLSFGIESAANVRIVNYRYHSLDAMQFEVMIPGAIFSATVPFVGKHFLYNLAAAIAVASEYGLSADQLREGISRLQPVSMRGRVLRLKDGPFAGVTVWDDSYNANPQAVVSVLETAARLTGFKRRIAALGDMLELGSSSPTWHEQVGKVVAEKRFDLLIAVGELSRFICRGAQASGMSSAGMQHFESSSQAAEFLAGELGEGDFLLVKGSRGIGMDRVVQRIEGK
jgi:UDP-N-acetylmuramoyl-tripeptide--D-alanyl-D-alanine ligase